jgi:hypothetical protein
MTKDHGFTHDWKEDQHDIGKPRQDYDVNKLPDEWLKIIDPPFNNYPCAHVLKDCADQLQAALPVWKQITDDPDTWPPIGDFMLSQDADGPMCVEGSSLEYASFVHAERTPDDDFSIFVGRWWRPLCSLDYPPEGK